MYAVTGITGKVGGKVALSLLEAGLPVRAVVRDAEKGKKWEKLGCDIAIADISDVASMALALKNVDGAFLMVPPNYDPEPGFPQSVQYAAAVREAILISRPAKLVFLSTIGAQVSQLNLLNNSKIIEEMLRTVSVPSCFLRAAWFMENAAWDVEAARSGVIDTFLQPSSHKIPMVSTSDIGKNAAEILREEWNGVRIVELEGRMRYSADDIANGFSAILGTSVSTNPVPRDSWENLFRSQGMQNPIPRIRMLDGFNQDWIEFEGGSEIEHRIGDVALTDVLRQLML